MDEQKSTEQDDERHAAHLKNLAEPGSNYAFGYLKGTVKLFLDGVITKQNLRKTFAELEADLRAVEQ